jgi:DNA adenine methylase
MAFNGGKAQPGVYQSLINMMPPHNTYIEPFLGAGTIMRYKRPAAVNIGIEIDPLTASQFPTMAGTTIMIGDATNILRSFNYRGDELVYCDPPYLQSTRSNQQRLYKHELTDAQHLDLFKLLRTLPCMVMISGYWSPIYADLLSDWRVETFQAVKRSGQQVTEYVWMNFSKPFELHDYGYLGSDYRERERIKRKKQRWIDGLTRLPDFERYAIMAAIEEMRTKKTFRDMAVVGTLQPTKTDDLDAE